MIRTYAIVNNEKVTNLIYIDNINVELIRELNGIEIPDDAMIDIGFKYIDGVFIEPPRPEPTYEYKKTASSIQKNKEFVELSFEEIEDILESIMNEDETES
jgi:hypothetical protein